MVKHTIDHYISSLLYYNECVVVPGFGAFLTRYYSAEINSATHMFRPPSKRVAFNARIQENDGLLAQHIAQTEQVSYQKALESIEISVRSWKKLLRAGKKVNLTGIGRLFMSDKGKLQFNPAYDINYDINSYGLNIFRANAMDRDLEIKRSVNKAIEKHQGKKGKTSESQKSEPVVRDINYRRWVSILGPVAALLVVGAYLYTNPASLERAQQQVSGIFLNDSAFKIENYQSSSEQIAESESAIGFSDGERLNGEFGPEDDVLSEEQVEEAKEETDLTMADEDEALADADPKQQDEGKELNEVLSDTDKGKALELEEQLNPNSTDNALGLSNESSSPKTKNKKQKSILKEMVEDDFIIPDKPLYKVKKRPEGYQEDEAQNNLADKYDYGYTYAADLNPTGTSGTSLDPKIEEKAESRPDAHKAVEPEETKAPLKEKSNFTAQEKDLGEGNYQVVVGAFSNKRNAERYTNQLKANGWLSYTYHEGSLYRVAIGKLESRADAERLLQQVKLQVNAQAWVNLQ